MPSFDDWEGAVLNVVDNLVDVSNSFPRMEAKIFGNWDEGGDEGGALRVIMKCSFNFIVKGLPP